MKRLYAFSLLLTLALPFAPVPVEAATCSGWTRGNVRYDRFMDMGISLFYRGDFDSAIINFRRARAAAKTATGRSNAYCHEDNARAAKYYHYGR